MFIENTGANDVTLVFEKNGASITLVITPGNRLKVVGPNAPVNDLLFAPLTNGISMTVVSGADKAFPLTVQQSYVGGGAVMREHAPVNLDLVANGFVTLSAVGETETAPFSQLIADGHDVTMFKPNALMLAPDYTDVFVFDESSGTSCKPITLVHNLIDLDENAKKKMFVHNTKTGKTTCNNGRALGGSLLMVYDPEVVPTDLGEVPFVYDTDDNYWDVTSQFTPPAGCTVDITTQDVHVDQSTEAAIFTMTCGSSTPTGAAVGGAPNSRASSVAQAVHTARDCTKRGCPPQRVTSNIAVTKAAPQAQARGVAFQGAAVTGRAVSAGVSSTWTNLVMIVGILAVLGVVLLSTMRRNEE